ncbi:tol-pal system-associated acyl-CoA thioesterase [Methylobacillus gramineus]|uniref:tol-pal system-associated acyl-CoA thioesterase n=1 Tax=Methylobacillus gramineus TaxID=755169 RepID=UPI001CFF69E7|nr:tol-pal system-associated acyl-CoA thioesterase [Methylobacillus gramineus]MCB5186105.1 tol-pal system-associated acyl-CoA thioesterase [Methylobacillus gramineus]
MEFHWPIRVYYEDTDSGGVVYHSNYLNFMERARTEFLRSHGFGQAELRQDLGVLFVVRGLTLKYRRPARFDDALQVITRLIEAGRSLIKFEQAIYRDDELLVNATIEIVCIDAEQFRPVIIPAVMRNMINPTEFE